jgi:hypothetical protein
MVLSKPESEHVYGLNEVVARRWKELLGGEILDGWRMTVERTFATKTDGGLWIDAQRTAAAAGRTLGPERPSPPTPGDGSTSKPTSLRELVRSTATSLSISGSTWCSS